MKKGQLTLCLNKTFLILILLSFVIGGCNCGKRNPAAPGNGNGRIGPPQIPPAISEDDGPCAPEPCEIAAQRFEGHLLT
jgi:hypothetical protein